MTLFATGIAAALPALLLFTTPVRDLLALLVNDSEPSADTSWGFIASHYPGALVELLRANVGFLRRGEWYTALFLVGGVLALLLLVWRRRETRDAATTVMAAGAVLALGYVLAAPVFSAFRLELVFVPDGRVGRGARGGTSWRLGWRSGTVRLRAGSPDSSNPNAWIGRSELPALAPLGVAGDNKSSGQRPPDGLTMRKTATHTNRLWRGIPSWKRSVLAMLAMLAALVQLGGSSAAPGDPPNINGDWSAPFAWPIVAVHMSLTSTGEVFSLDGFGAALNSERVWNPQTGIFASVPYGRNLFCGGHVQLPDGRTLIVGGHIARL